MLSYFTAKSKFPCGININDWLTFKGGFYHGFSGHTQCYGKGILKWGREKQMYVWEGQSGTSYKYGKEGR